jgi:hypothetical protein
MTQQNGQQNGGQGGGQTAGIVPQGAQTTAGGVQRQGNDATRGDFSADYRKRENEYRAKAMGFMNEETALRQRVRAMTHLSDDDREAVYRKAYSSIHKRWDNLASDFVARETNRRAQLENKVYRQDAPGLAPLLAELSGADTERLKATMQTARRTGQRTLARAVAMVAHDTPDAYPLFREWSQGEPEVAAAIEQLSGLPPTDRLVARTNAMKPFRANFEDLRPTQKDRERDRQAEARENYESMMFWGRPVRGKARR